LLKVKPKLIAKPVRPALVKPVVDYGLLGLSIVEEQERRYYQGPVNVDH
jgi:hypothetical protein